MARHTFRHGILEQSVCHSQMVTGVGRNFTTQMIVSGLIWLAIIAAAVAFSLKARQLSSGLLTAQPLLSLSRQWALRKSLGSCNRSVDRCSCQRVITRGPLQRVSSENVVMFVLITTDTAFVQELYTMNVQRHCQF